MKYNLIDEPWIPVRRKLGARERIAPWQITDSHDSDPLVSLDAPRADFNGSLAQFLIGILQTTCGPNNETDWQTWYVKPPSPAELRERMTTVRHAFNLIGDGPLFMQEPGIALDDERRIASLLIDEPGGETGDGSTDLFVKRRNDAVFCEMCAATALFTLQTNAPTGGSGHMTSFRGGGPLTTLVLVGTLWETMWLNVLPSPNFHRIVGDPRKSAEVARFPWMGPLPHDGPPRTKTTSLDIHPDHVYWGMPRRIRLGFVLKGPHPTCTLCGLVGRTHVESFAMKPHGYDYKGPRKHPLSPFYTMDDGVESRKGASMNGAYRHWLGLVQPDPVKRRDPAPIVSHHLSRDRHGLGMTTYRLWTFGYDMDNMKAKAWNEGTMPLVLVQNGRETYEEDAALLVQASESAADELRKLTKKAIFHERREVPADKLDTAFWSNTERPFYEHLADLRGVVGDEVARCEVRRRWKDVIVRAAVAAFDAATEAGPIEAADPKRAALARRDLRRALWGPELAKRLQLPVERAEQRRPKAKAAKEKVPS